MRIPKKQSVHVVFDTNVIKSEDAHQLINSATKELIAKHKSHIDLDIHWHLPDIVKHERIRQMRVQSNGLLPQVEKIEKLLGHNLNITKENLYGLIDVHVNKSISSAGLSILPLDESTVNWNQLIHAALYREPPFDPEKSDKGFKDALILATFNQLLNAQPATPAICIICLVSNDSLLREAFDKLKDGRTNARLLSSLAEVDGLINTLASSVSEDVVNKVRAIANKYFYIPNDTKTLFYVEKINEKVRQKYSALWQTLPQDATEYVFESSALSYPEFVRKERQRFHFISRLSYQIAYYKQEAPAEEKADISGLLAFPSQQLAEQKSSKANLLYQLSQQLAEQKSSYANLLYQQLDSIKPVRSKVSEKQYNFTIHWSANVTATHLFKRASVDNIEIVP
jgi:hypothetical protein